MKDMMGNACKVWILNNRAGSTYSYNRYFESFFDHWQSYFCDPTNRTPFHSYYSAQEESSSSLSGNYIGGIHVTPSNCIDFESRFQEYWSTL